MEQDRIPLLAVIQWTGDQINQVPQQIVAAVAIFSGALLGGYGALLVKPLFILAGAVLSGLEVYRACASSESASLAAAAPFLAALVALPSTWVWYRAYPGFAFLIGCVLGAGTVFLLVRFFWRGLQPVDFLGATVLGCLLTGLAFARYDRFCWRIFTPPLGALASAASLRFYGIALFWPDVLWTTFVDDLRAGPAEATLDWRSTLFWCGWVVASMMGWYFQLAPLVGLRTEISFGILRRGPASEVGTKGGSANQDGTTSPGSLKQALLSPRGSDAATTAADPRSPSRAEDQASVGRSGSKDTASHAPSEAMVGVKDNRAEMALLVGVIHILALNWMVSSKPVMLAGHMVFCAAFLPLISAGMVSYSSAGMLLPKLFGPRVAKKQLRHFTHATFSILALLCLVVGCGCIHYAHLSAGEAESEIPRGWKLTLHIGLGYFAIFLLATECVKGFLKLYLRVVRGSEKVLFHAQGGRLAFFVTAIDQILGYSLPGLLPTYGLPLLAATLILSVFFTLFFLNERHRNGRRHRLEELQYQYEQEQARLRTQRLRGGAEAFERAFSCADRTFSLVHTHLSAGGSCPNVLSDCSTQLPSRSEPTLAFEVAEKAIARQYNHICLQQAFFEWHRQVQSDRLKDAEHQLQGQDRLVQFMAESVAIAGPAGSGDSFGQEV